MIAHAQLRLAWLESAAQILNPWPFDYDAVLASSDSAAQTGGAVGTKLHMHSSRPSSSSALVSMSSTDPVHLYIASALSG